MLANNIEGPDDYLAHSYQVLSESGVLKSYPKINNYYQELCDQFKLIFYDNEIEQFVKWGKLLAIDAQIQILLELTELSKNDLGIEFEMSEEKIIQMIRHDKDSFYREITGGNLKQKPKWGLIYLSEEEVTFYKDEE